ncbi:MAG: hypothetical protein D6715_07740 [Calditrichaeota bacterium]|nr:MAG: hypothetical protein D6715_07740 [Calditrichota bacterium]
MMSKMRELSVVFLWVLVFAFLGLMVLEWGMDITGISTRGNVIGKIDGRKITYEEFMKLVRNAAANEQQRTGKPLDEEAQRKLRNQIWESLIQQAALEKELKKHHIQISEKEVAYHVLNNPPKDIREAEALKTDGKFDFEKYRQALRDPQLNLAEQLGEFIRQNLPYQKLQEVILAGVLVTEEEVKAEYMSRHVKARIEYLYFPLSKFTKTPVDVTDAEVKAYYNAHKEDFKVEEKRKLNYVLFSTEPTSEDSARVYKLAEDILDQARSGADFSKLADEYSEDPSVSQNHGDLGFFNRQTMVKEFSDAAFAAKPGEIVGPVKTRFGLHIIKVIERKVEKGVPQVHAAHILLKFEPSYRTLDTAMNLATNFAEEAKDDGLKPAADRLGYKIEQTPEFARRNFIPGFGVLPEAVAWAFDADVGDVSNPYRTNRGYVVFELAEVHPAGYRPFEEVKSICKNRVETEKRKALLRQYAERFQQAVQSGQSFAKILAQDTAHIAMYDSVNYFPMDVIVPKIGRAPAVAAAAFQLPVKQPSGLLESDRGFYYIRVLDRTPFDQEDYTKRRDQIRNFLLRQKQQEVLADWLDRITKNVKVEDYRYKFFRS